MRCYSMRALGRLLLDAGCGCAVIRCGLRDCSTATLEPFNALVKLTKKKHKSSSRPYCSSLKFESVILLTVLNLHLSLVFVSSVDSDVTGGCAVRTVAF